MIKIGNYFKLLNTPVYFIEHDWESFLKVIDAVGIWHYSRTIPDKKDYIIDIFDQETGSVTLICNRTHTKFRFDNDWHCSFHYVDSEGREKENHPVEGTLFSTFQYVDALIDIRAIKFINPFIYL